MKKILLLSILTTFCFSQTEEWIYHNSLDGVSRVKPDGSENELLMGNVSISDVSEDGNKLLLMGNPAPHTDTIYLINLESMDTLSITYVHEEYGPDQPSPLQPTLTYDENVILFLNRESDGYESYNELWKYSFIDSSETVIADWLDRNFGFITLSPDKREVAVFKNYGDSVDVAIVDIQSGETSILGTFGNLYNGCGYAFSVPLVYWGEDDYIYFTICEASGLSQLLKIHISNGEPAQLIENEIYYTLSTSDSHLEKLIYSKVVTDSLEYWTIDLESNETSYLGNMYGEIDGYPIFWNSQAWSPNHSKVAIDGLAFTDTPWQWLSTGLNIFDVATDSIMTIVDDAWAPMFWVGESSVSVVEYMEGWNLIGLPLEVEDASYNILFPESLEGTLYSFNGGYITESYLTSGEGYWLRFNNAGSAPITGTNINELTISLSEGWNLVSGISETVSIYSVSDPDGIIVSGTLYGYDGAYVSSDELMSGKGYWLRAFQDGEVSLIVGEDPPAGVSYSTEIQPIFNNNCISCHINGGGYFGGLDLSTYENLMSGNSNNGPVVTIGDGANSYIIQKLQGTAPGSQMPDGASPLSSDQINLIAQWIDEGAMNNRHNLSKVGINQIQSANTLKINGLELFFGLELSAREKLSYSLPPKPPAGAFDVRFKGDTRVTKEKAEIEVMSTTETITIAYNVVINAGEHMNWILTPENGKDFILEGAGEITIPSSERFILNRESVIPITFTLHQNYPNPFNPITTLRYDLPSDALVTLIIYDMLGREITQLVNTTQEAGFKSVQWNATDSMGKPVSAGVYLYQIKAGEFVQTKKMVLLK